MYWKNKIYISSAIIFFFIGMFCWGYFTPEKQEIKIEPVKVEETIPVPAPEPPQPVIEYGTFDIIGNSMAPYGFRNGEVATERLTNICEVGDVCDFLCLADRCKHYQNLNTFKNVTKKDGEKYWFEGRFDKYNITKKVTETKKQIITTTYWDTSFDSSNYGWMTNNVDIIITGVVLKKQ